MKMSLKLRMPKRLVIITTYYKIEIKTRKGVDKTATFTKLNGRGVLRPENFTCFLASWDQSTFWVNFNPPTKLVT